MLSPLRCAPLLGNVDRQLVELLRSLGPNDWEKPTIAGHWRVKHVAAHLLDTQVRKLTIVRDGCFSDGPKAGETLPAFLNRRNAEGAALYSRLSPQVLASLLAVSGRESADFHESLAPDASAAFAVSWAGEEQSANWFDTARELTERWHHQQQIRLATGRPGILTPQWYGPVLDTFLRGAPHAYRDTPAPSGAVLRIEITGHCGGVWFLIRGADRWHLDRQAPQAPPAAAIAIPQEIACRVFTKGMARQEARALCRIDGDEQLASVLLSLTAIVG